MSDAKVNDDSQIKNRKFFACIDVFSQKIIIYALDSLTFYFGYLKYQALCWHIFLFTKHIFKLTIHYTNYGIL